MRTVLAGCLLALGCAAAPSTTGPTPEKEERPDPETARARERIVGTWRYSQGEGWWFAFFDGDGGYLLREHHDGAGGAEGFVREKGSYRVLDAGTVEIVLDGKAGKRAIRFSDANTLQFNDHTWRRQ